MTILSQFSSAAQVALNSQVTKVSQYVGDAVNSQINNLPPVAQNVLQSQMSQLGVPGLSNRPMDDTSRVDNYKVKLISATSMRFNSPSQIERVVFEVSPTVSEDRTVEYSQVSPVHMPGSIQVYKRTNARSFGVTAQLISRNRNEATKNIQILQTLRGWTMPYFGTKSSTGEIGNPKDEANKRIKAELLGAPPDVLYLYAYSNDSSRGGGHVNINRVPVVLSSLSISYPDEVDYIPTISANMEPMPAKMQVSLTLLETHSPVEYETFSLSDFKAGKLKNF